MLSLIVRSASPEFGEIESPVGAPVSFRLPREGCQHRNETTRHGRLLQSRTGAANIGGLGVIYRGCLLEKASKEKSHVCGRDRYTQPLCALLVLLFVSLHHGREGILVFSPRVRDRVGVILQQGKMEATKVCKHRVKG